MIRKAQHSDIDTVMTIVASAQRALAELGIDQWQDGYPSRAAIEADVNTDVGYVAVDAHNRPIGYAAIVFTGEEAYKQIADERWNTPNDYVVVHRLCVDGTQRRRGIALELMQYAADTARRANLTAFRIDTHRGNVRMLGMMQRLGFNFTGIIRYDSGERMAYDLDLNLSNTL